MQRKMRKFSKRSNFYVIWDMHFLPDSGKTLAKQFLLIMWIDQTETQHTDAFRHLRLPADSPFIEFPFLKNLRSTRVINPQKQRVITQKEKLVNLKLLARSGKLHAYRTMHACSLPSMQSGKLADTNTSNLEIFLQREQWIQRNLLNLLKNLQNKEVIWN